MTNAKLDRARARPGQSLALLGFALVEESGLNLEALAWKSFRAAVGESIFETTAVVMASCDALDARGISCMLVSGLLATVADEQTRVGDGAWAIQLAGALLNGRHDRVAVLAWEKPEDFASGLAAMRGDPNYERPIGWTAGIEESLLRSMATGQASIERGSGRATDRAACLVLGRSPKVPSPGEVSFTLALQREVAPDDHLRLAGTPSLELPVASPVEPLARIIAATTSLRTSGERQRTVYIPTSDKGHFEVTVSAA